MRVEPLGSGGGSSSVKLGALGSGGGSSSARVGPLGSGGGSSSVRVGTLGSGGGAAHNIYSHIIFSACMHGCWAAAKVGALN